MKKRKLKIKDLHLSKTQIQTKEISRKIFKTDRSLENKTSQTFLLKDIQTGKTFTITDSLFMH